MTLTKDYVKEKEASMSSYLFSRKRFEYIIKRIKMSRGKILIVGFGHPFELQIAEEKGFEIIGLDRDEYAINEAIKLGFDVIRTDASDSLPFANNNFDGVFAHHVIEHMEKPTVFISEASRILKKNGFLIIETPDIRYNRIFYNDPTHISPFSKSQLEDIMSNQFSIVLSQLFVPVTFFWRYFNFCFRFPNVLKLNYASVLTIGKKKS